MIDINEAILEILIKADEVDCEQLTCKWFRARAYEILDREDGDEHDRNEIRHELFSMGLTEAW